jgi:hypothetical protein
MWEYMKAHFTEFERRFEGSFTLSRLVPSSFDRFVIVPAYLKEF